jgi:hypothetical protein
MASHSVAPRTANLVDGERGVVLLHLVTAGRRAFKIHLSMKGMEGTKE